MLCNSICYSNFVRFFFLQLEIYESQSTDNALFEDHSRFLIINENNGHSHKNILEYVHLHISLVFKNIKMLYSMLIKYS